MVIINKEILLVIFYKALENMFGKMETFSKEILKIIKNLEKVN